MMKTKTHSFHFITCLILMLLLLNKTGYPQSGTINFDAPEWLTLTDQKFFPEGPADTLSDKEKGVDFIVASGEMYLVADQPAGGKLFFSPVISAIDSTDKMGCLLIRFRNSKGRVLFKVSHDSVAIDQPPYMKVDFYKNYDENNPLYSMEVPWKGKADTLVEYSNINQGIKMVIINTRYAKNYLDSLEFQTRLERLLSKVSDWVWGIPLLVLLFGTHLFLTFRLRFIQRFIGKAIKLSFQRKTEGAGDVSHFGALTTALAATIGTGNIVGVATAIAAGGPGAVLWTWLTGVFGIATKYAEAVLSVKYRIKTPSGQMAGGPMYVLERGLKMKWLGMLFAALTAVTAFGIGNMVQANSISTMVNETFKVSPWITGVLMTVLTAIVILGGIKSIARVCEGLVPFMAVFYMIGCAVLLILGASSIPDTITLIFKSAFTGHAVIGGFVGAGVREAIRYGIARGLFSNESGLGSAPIVAAAAQTKNPVRQALVSSTGTFWDTVVVCAMTGLVLVNSQEWLNGLSGAALTKAAFADIPVLGPIILTVGLLTFVFSTILGWSYYGEKAAEYLFGSWIVQPYRFVWVIMVMVGSVATMPAVWSFADIANGLMAIPNLISLLLLSGVIVAETRKFLWSDKLDDVSGN